MSFNERKTYFVLELPSHITLTIPSIPAEHRSELSKDESFGSISTLLVREGLPTFDQSSAVTLP